MSRALTKHDIFIRKRNRFPYQIAIVASGNPVMLRDTTLNILKAYKVPIDHITIFVHTKEEKGYYESVLLHGTYGRIVNTEMVKTYKVYNVIQYFYTVGTPVVHVNDCIQGLYEKTEEGVKILKNFIGLLNLGFSECVKGGFSVWGVSVSRKTMDTEIQTGLLHIPGGLWGCIVDGVGIQLTQGNTESYERSILYYKKDGGLLRLSMFAVVECFQKADSEILEKGFCKLLKKYPLYVMDEPFRLVDLSKK